MNPIYQTLDHLIEQSRADLIRDVQRLVQIKSVESAGENGYPFGQGNHDCLELCLSIGRKMGFSVRNVDEMCGYAEYGSGPEMVMVLTHLDVVPEGEGWLYAPYGAQIADGRLYGRGAMDDKGPAVSSLYALKALQDSGVSLRRRIRLLFGLNEESGCKGVRYYIKNGEELPVMGFTPDAGYPVVNGEKGIWKLTYTFSLAGQGSGCRILEVRGGNAYNMVPEQASAVLKVPERIGEKFLRSLPGYITGKWENGFIFLEAKGRGAHAARPEQGENAIGRLFLALSGLPLEGRDARLRDFLNENFAAETRGERMGIACRDQRSGDLTVNLAKIQCREDQAVLHIEIRCPVTCDRNAVLTAFRSRMQQGGFLEQACQEKKSLYIPPDCELVKRLCAVYEAYTGRREPPRCISGGTYAKEMPNLVAFGPKFPEDNSRIHKPNEYIALSELEIHTKINAAAMYELAK